MKPLSALVRSTFLSALLAGVAITSAGAQTAPTPTRRPVKINQARAESLYVSVDPADHPPRNFERDIAAKARTDSIYAARSRGVKRAALSRKTAFVRLPSS